MTSSSSSLSRRSALAGLGAGGLGLALATSVRQASAQDSSDDVHPMVGTWIVDRNPDNPAEPPTIAVFAADGAIIDPVLGTAGSWKSTGPRTAAWTLAGLEAEGADGYYVVRVTGEVDESGMSYSATNTVTIVGPDGTVLATIPGAPRGIRLPIEPVEAGGTGLTGFPTWTPAPPPEATPAS